MIAIHTETVNDAFIDILAALKHQGKEIYVKGLRTIEVEDMIISISNPKDRLIYLNERKWKHKYGAAEFLWYQTANPDVNVILPYLPRWCMYVDNFPDNVNVNSQYGAIYHSQVLNVIERLKSDPNTRQAVIAIYDKSYTNYYGMDTPCTLNLSFSIRDNKLNMRVTMRSNDCVFGFCNDAYNFTCLQELIANELGIEVGCYIHYAYSMHIYDRHFDLLDSTKHTFCEPFDIAIQPTTKYSNFWDAKDPYWADVVDFEYFAKQRIFMF